MSPKLVELRPDRSQLDPNFNGYKLSLEKIPILKQDLDIPVHKVLPSNDQYSFLHAKLFGLHNHLTGENLNDSVYFVDKSQSLWKAHLDEFSTTMITTKVWQVPNPKPHHDGDFNFSLKFASNSLAVLSSGNGVLYVLCTAMASESPLWQCLFSSEVIGHNRQFVIQDVVCVGKELHCLLFTVEQDSSTKRHAAVLHWVTLAQMEDQSWGEVALRELKCKGDMYYAHLEPTCHYIYVVSDNGCRFTIDSENPVVAAQSVDKKYEWTESREDITLKFQLPENFQKDEIQVNVRDDEIDVSYRGDVLLNGKLASKVNSGVTTWNTTNNFLEVLLVKGEAGRMWQKLVEGDESGEHHIDSSVVEEAHQRMEHLCNEAEVTEAQDEQGPIFSRQQVEECDYEDDKLAVFERLCCISHEVTHRTNLGSHHVLLTAKLSENLPPAMAIRYDVDACLWQPLESDNDFALKHEATLLAFGYIQASKQQKKFCACAPDLSYSVICESSRHIFLYRQNKPVRNAELRNRTTGKRFGTIAQQQVISISDEEILGIHATNSTLFILTDNAILALGL